MLSAATAVGLAGLLVLGSASPASAAELSPPEIVTGAPANASAPIVYDGELWIRGSATGVWFRSVDGSTFSEVVGSPVSVADPVVFDGDLYFTTAANQVWRYNDVDGFVLVESIDVAGEMLAHDGLLYASARIGGGDYLLYSYVPGGSFTEILAPDASDTFPHNFVVIDNVAHAFFYSGNIETLYRIDGSTLTAIGMPAPGPLNIRTVRDTARDGGVFYVVVSSLASSELYSYSLGGALTLVPGPWPSAQGVAAFDGIVYVFDNEGLLYRSSASGFEAVPGAPFYFADNSIEFAGILLATGYPSFEIGVQLYGFDGAEFDDPFVVFDSANFVEFDGDVYFFGANDRDSGDRVLWRIEIAPVSQQPELADTGPSASSLMGAVAVTVLLAGAGLLAASRRRASA